VFEVTNRQWDAETLDNDEYLASDGRVMEMLSEHLCQGWLEGYLLTGRHGLFNCYEAFIHIVDSMFNQHAKWLKVSAQLPWRRPIASLNYLLPRTSGSRTTTASRTRTLASSITWPTRRPTSCASTCRPTPTACSPVTDHCLRSRNYVNVVIAGKQPAPQWLTMDAAVAHCTAGHRHLDLGQQRPGRRTRRRDGCCGDVPTLETWPPSMLRASICRH
jgi:xylulose-5-phosphate/fructose-6-phosphate phosphoketolase